MPPPGPRLLVVLNPHGGGGRAARRLEAVRPRLEAAGAHLEVHATGGPGDARELAATLPLAPDQGLLVVGGDGTLQQVVDGLLARGEGPLPDLALLPAGTGNALAWDLGLREDEDAVTALLSGRRRPLDVMRLRVDGRTLHAVGIVGWGLAADAGRLAERMRRLGPSRYRLGAALAVLLAPVDRRATVVLDGERHEGAFAMLFVGNTATTGAGMVLLPGARIDDGLLDVLLVPRRSRVGLLRLLAGVGKGRHLQDAGVRHRRVRRVSLEAESPGLLNVDGELLTGRAFELEVLPGALTLRA